MNQTERPTKITPPIIGRVHSIRTSEIIPMPNNPFQIRDDPSMCELIESISQQGILAPIEVRHLQSGKYEIISGSRRHHAAVTAGLDLIPAIILDLSNENAIIRMVDSNIQRENILPSERAFAYKKRMEAIKRKAGKHSETRKENVPKISVHFRSDDAIGNAASISGDTVRNYISLTQLIPELLKLVDQKKIALTPAYQLTGLSKEEQYLLLETIECEQVTPSLSQAQRIRRLSAAEQLNEDMILSILSEQKKPVKNDVTLSEEKLRKYFPRYYSPAKIESLIFKLLDMWVRKYPQNHSTQMSSN
ncbi:MAG: ParB/RepB/Spo0J family partition protein [Tyzzerella sp.]|nr:ParB/RepB/Spo0J family partition protein [Tyzzerella sp.]